MTTLVITLLHDDRIMHIEKSYGHLKEPDRSTAAWEDWDAVLCGQYDRVAGLRASDQIVDKQVFC